MRAWLVAAFLIFLSLSGDLLAQETAGSAAIHSLAATIGLGKEEAEQSVPERPAACCKVCTTGKACGDSCISASLTCHKGAGCACNGGSTIPTTPTPTPTPSTPTTPTPSTPQPPATRPSGQALTPVFSSAAINFQSYVRVWNDSGAATAVTITILNAQTGLKLASWITAAPANTSIQYGIAQIESAANPPIRGANIPTAYTLYIDSGATSTTTTKLQSVIWSPVTGYFENVSGCSQITEPHNIANVHTTRLVGYPSTVYVFNDTNQSRTLTLQVYDAGAGQSMGNYSFGTIQAFGTGIIAEADIERALTWSPTSSQLHAIVQTTMEGANDDGMNVPPYRVKHLVQNGANGAYADMTEFCSGVTYAN